MPHTYDEPIAALASPPGGAARGLIRLAGWGLHERASEWFGPAVWPARGARSVPVEVPLPGWSVAPRAMAAVWPDSRSYCGQPTVELHLPGSSPLLEAVLQECYRRGIRAAQPGEFTLRAFLAGRLDLLQAEAVLSVIDASDQAELQAALGQLSGGLSSAVGLLRTDLLDLLCELEAGLDFIEEDIQFVTRTEVYRRIVQAKQQMEDLCQRAAQRSSSRPQRRVVIAGLPNAGKSTLFNALTRTAGAIVSPAAGTTRDFLEAQWQGAGLSICLVDTAGWELPTDELAAAAQSARHSQLVDADLIMWCSATQQTEAEATFDEQWRLAAEAGSAPLIRVLTKTDLESNDPEKTSAFAIQRVAFLSENVIPVSAQTGYGLLDLEIAVGQVLTHQQRSQRQWLGSSAARCRGSLAAAAVALERAEEIAATPSAGDELIAADVRAALDALGEITGVIYHDDLLGRIFSKFCIGK